VKGLRGTLPIFLSDVKARHDKMVGSQRAMSDKRGTMRAGRNGRTADMTPLHDR
jgi:hypothetical protein